MGEVITLDPLTLVDLDTAREYLSIDTQEHDALIRQLINFATSEIEMYCRRRLLARPYDTASVVAGKQPTLKVDGNGGNKLMLPEYPVNSVTSITERYEDGTLTRALNITGLRILTGHKVWVPYDSYTLGHKNIEIVCNLGYAAGTHDRERRALESAACRWLQILWQDRAQNIGRGGSFSVGSEGVTLIPDAVPKDVQSKLAPFVRLV